MGECPAELRDGERLAGEDDRDVDRQQQGPVSGVAGALFGAGMAIKDAFVFSIAPPPIEGMSNTGGFEGFVQLRSGNDYAALEAATQQLVAAAATRPELRGVNTTYSAQVPRVHIDVDVEKAKLLSVSMDEINTTLQSTFGSFYVNDFNRSGRVFRVYLQSEAEFRAHSQDIRNVYVRSSTVSLVPLTAVARAPLSWRWNWLYSDWAISPSRIGGCSRAACNS